MPCHRGQTTCVALVAPIYPIHVRNGHSNHLWQAMLRRHLFRHPCSSQRFSPASHKHHRHHNCHPRSAHRLPLMEELMVHDPSVPYRIHMVAAVLPVPSNCPPPHHLLCVKLLVQSSCMTVVVVVKLQCLIATKHNNNNNIRDSNHQQ